MNDPGFKVESRRQTAPFLPRDTYRDYFRFSDSERTVLLEPSAARQLREAAYAAHPLETGGLLAGRGLRDDQGDYVVVSGFVKAAGSQRRAAFEIPTQELGTLRAQAARDYPGSDEIGWWHSHSGPSYYSPVDRNNQRMFQRPDSVGLLLFATGTELARAYMGPDALDLGVAKMPRVKAPDGSPKSAPAGVQPTPAAGPASGTVPVGQRIPGDTNGRPGFPGPGHARQIWRPAEGQSLNPRVIRLARLAIIVALVIYLIFLLLSLHSMSGRISGLQQSLSGQVGSAASLDNGRYHALAGQLASIAAAVTPPASSPSPSVSWSCMPTGSDTYKCSAAGSPGTLGTAGWTVQWFVGGKDVEEGSYDVPITVKSTEQVQAVLVSPAGKSYPGSALTLP